MKKESDLLDLNEMMDSIRETCINFMEEDYSLSPYYYNKEDGEQSLDILNVYFNIEQCRNKFLKLYNSSRQEIGCDFDACYEFLIEYSAFTLWKIGKERESYDTICENAEEILRQYILYYLTCETKEAKIAIKWDKNGDIYYNRSNKKLRTNL